jgi:glycosyltransferase involved in cell wall biosynthesis
MPYTVLTIVPADFCADFCAHARIWEEVKMLRHLGHRVVMTTYHNGDDMPGLEIRRIGGIPWIRDTRLRSARHKIYLDAALLWKTLRVAREIKPDIIHAHMHAGALIGFFASRLLRIPLIFDYHGSLSGAMFDHGFLHAESPLVGAWQALERSIDRLPDAVITSSYHAAATLHQRWNCSRDTLYTVPNSANTNRFRPFDGSSGWEAERRRLRAELSIPQDRRLVVYLGLSTPYQGTNKLLEAARIVVEQRPDIHFLVMGSPNITAYAALAEALGIRDHVTLPGPIFYREAHAYLALGDIAVASQMSEAEGEGAITNYLAMGLPVVAFDTPANREILGDVGRYAPRGDAAALAEEMIALLDDPREMEILSATGRAKAVHEHPWELGALQILAIYKRALARSAGEPLPPVPTVL